MTPPSDNMIDWIIQHQIEQDEIFQEQLFEEYINQLEDDDTSIH